MDIWERKRSTQRHLSTDDVEKIHVPISQRFSTITVNTNVTAQHLSPESPQIPQLLVDSATLARHGNPRLYIKPVCQCNRSDTVHLWMHRLKDICTTVRSWGTINVFGSFCLNRLSVLEKNPFISLSPYHSWKSFWKIPHDFLNWLCWVERNR